MASFLVAAVHSTGSYLSPSYDWHYTSYEIKLAYYLIIIIIKIHGLIARRCPQHFLQSLSSPLYLVPFYQAVGCCLGTILECRPAILCMAFLSCCLPPSSPS